MPELPEVEIIVRNLKNDILGQTIRNVEVTKPKMIAYPSADEFIERLKGKKVTDVSRRGKYIIISLDGDESLVAHLRMTGNLYTRPIEEPLDNYAHIVMDLEDLLSLRFSDRRRFGRLWLVDNDELEEVTGINKIGLEPLDNKLTGDYLREKISKSKKAIKTILLEQTPVAGVGNIYADEILFKAGIRPMKRAVDMADYEFDNLAKAIPIVIDESIKANELTNDNSFINSTSYYRNAPWIKIHNQYGKPCPNCGFDLIKVEVNGRNTTYCPKCQH